MTSRKKVLLRPLGCLVQVLCLPLSYLAGLFTGLAAPLAAIAGMLLGVRLLTGKMPWLVPAGSEETDQEGQGATGRQLALRLVSWEDAKRFLAEQRDKAGAEIARMRDEIQAVARQKE